MPLSMLDQRRKSSFSLPTDASFFCEELHLPVERRFWKPEFVTDHRRRENEGISMMPGSKTVSSPLSKLHLLRASPAEFLQLSQPYISNDQKIKSSLEHPLMEPEKISLSNSSIRTEYYDSSSQLAQFSQSASIFVEGNRADLSGSNCEKKLLSSSLSDILDKKLALSSTNYRFGQSNDAWNSNFEEDEHFRSMEEIEAQTIGNLLPDDDDLLSGIVDDISYTIRPNNGEDIDDDIFYSGGGIELEANDIINEPRSSNISAEEASNGQGRLNVPLSGEHPFGEHPSRTLFVRNISGNIEDSELRVLFEQYGDIHTLYTACKHRGFIIISYYDIRSAQNAMRDLQSKLLRHRNLDIHFSIPKDNPSEKDINQGTLIISNLDTTVSNDALCQIFGVYGEIKEIHETPQKHHHKFIEYYDIRAAEAALRALNRSDIAGKKIKLEPSHLGGARSFNPQLSTKLEQEESTGYTNNSLSGNLRFVPHGAITSNSFVGGSLPGLNSVVRAPGSLFLETSFNGICTSVPQNFPQNLSSPVRIASVGKHNNNQVVHGDLSHSQAQVIGYQGLPHFHAHSLPDYHNGVANGIPYTSNLASTVGININSRPIEGIESKNVKGININSDSVNSHSFDHNEGAFGVPRSASRSILGHQYAWNNSNAFHRPPGPVQWSSSPSFMNDISACPTPQMHGIPRAQSHMPNTVLPLHHHVGSAPTVNPSFFDRRHAYSMDSAESPFHPGSLGNMMFSGSPHQFHPLELASHNMFPHAAGNCIDPTISTAHIGISSPQQRCQIFHGRNSTIPLPSSFDGHPERIRGRRNDTSVNQADNKKQYELDIERIVRGEDSRTTLMIKNIPNKYTSKMLLSAIDENHRGTYDFIYLPIDFKNKCNVGYAFINMIDPHHIIPFYQSFNGKKWEKFNSEKVALLAYARIQGKAALIAHFQNSSLMNEDKRCRPILFHSDGPNAGDQEPFPMGSNVRSRSGRSRTTSSSEENNQGSPSRNSNGDGDTAGSLESSKDSE